MILPSRRWLLPALFVAALLPRLYHVRSPFMNFADHNTSNFSIIARNYLDRGFIATRLGQARNVEPPDGADLAIFAHHPPTIAILTALSFEAFGVKEWAARLLPLALSAATCPLLFLLGARLIGLRWGLLGAILFAFAPGAVYYGQMLDHEAFVTFFALLSLLAWCRHAETGERKWWRFCVGLVSVTTLVDWPGAYLAPAIAAASWLAPVTRSRAGRMASSAFVSAGSSLALVTLHILILKGSLADLLGSLSFRVLSGPRHVFTWTEYLHRIRIDLEYALTPAIFGLAVGGAAAVLAFAALLVGRRAIRRAAAFSGGADPGQEVSPLSLSVAIAISCSAHHLIFRNACHFNEHLIYYLLPPTLLLAAAGPAILARLIRERWTERSSVLAALLVVAWPLTLFAREAAPQARSYFNDLSVPGWPLLGQALERLIPEEGLLMSTENLSNPQFLHYLRRARFNEVSEDDLAQRGNPGDFLLRDLNAPIPRGVESLLAPFPAASVLNLSLYDLSPGSPSPEIPDLRPATIEWAPVETRFGDALLLSMAGHGPSRISIERQGQLVRFLGIPWTPDRAAGRMVHASFVWERLEGRSGTLTPEYDLVLERDGMKFRAPMMWPLPEKSTDLARLSPGETVRHDVDWFLGEWLPEGEYEVGVSVSDGGRLTRTRNDERRDPIETHARLGTIEVRGQGGD